MKSRNENLGASEAWKETNELSRSIGELSKYFPPEEEHKLTEQINRASEEAVAAIGAAQGCGDLQDSVRCFRKAKGFLYETKDHLEKAFHRGYMNALFFEGLRSKMDRCLAVLDNLTSDLEQTAIDPEHKK